MDTTLVVPTTTYTMDVYYIPYQIFYQIASRNELKYFHTEERISDAKLKIDDPIFAQKEKSTTSFVFEREGCIVSARARGGRYWIDLASNSEAAIDKVLTGLLDELPVTAPKEGRVPIQFWSLGSHGPQSNLRKIEVPHWDEIDGNYTEVVHDHLAEMMTNFKPSHGGQLILWQGKPGTGKTWALRALAHEWKDWAEFHYITDPEVFFGERAAYMMGVLLDDSSLEDEEDEGKWRVLILEDTGEILAADAKQKTGQALSRLLNVVDGLIGQGLKILVLVTTNEELGKLHPAVQRPGRCAARIEFKPLTEEEANDWLHRHDIKEDIRGAHAVADLYSMVNGYSSTAKSGSNTFGFVTA